MSFIAFLLIFWELGNGALGAAMIKVYGLLIE